MRAAAQGFVLAGEGLDQSLINGDSRSPNRRRIAPGGVAAEELTMQPPLRGKRWRVLNGPGSNETAVAVEWRTVSGNQAVLDT